MLCWCARLAVHACVDGVMHVCVWWRAWWRKRSLEYNSIGDGGAQHIATALGRNTTLTSLKCVVFVCVCVPRGCGRGVECVRLCGRRVVGEVLCWCARLGAVNACVDGVMRVCVCWRA